MVQKIEDNYKKEILIENKSNAKIIDARKK